MFLHVQESNWTCFSSKHKTLHDTFEGKLWVLLKNYCNISAYKMKLYTTFKYLLYVGYIRQYMFGI